MWITTRVRPGSIRRLHAMPRGHEVEYHTRAMRSYAFILVLRGHVRKGVGLSLTCRRLEGERTIAGAERRRQLRSMLFLGFWNSRSPLPLSLVLPSLSLPLHSFSIFSPPSISFSLSLPSFSSSSPSFCASSPLLLRSLFFISYLFIEIQRVWSSCQCPALSPSLSPALLSLIASLRSRLLTTPRKWVLVME